MRIRRTDANQKAVTEALRKIGAAVTPIHTLGHGVSDLLVSFRNRWFVLEIKNPNVPKADQALTPDEVEWIQEQDAHVAIIYTPEEAVRYVTA